MPIISLLIMVLLFVLVALVVKWAMAQLGVPQNIQMVVGLILALLFLLWLIQGISVLPPTWRLR
jgi:hypothetical protein